VFSSGLLLQRGGGERWYRALFARALDALGDDGASVGDARHRSLGHFWIDLQTLPLWPDKARGDDDLWVDRRPNPKLHRAVMTWDEGPNRPFALDDEAEGHRLDPPSRRTWGNQAREEWREFVPNESVEDAPCLLRIHEIEVDTPWLTERLEDRPLGDLAEGDAPPISFGNLESLGNVPRDRLPLPVEVGGEPDRLRTLRRAPDVCEATLLLFDDLVVRSEPVLYVDGQAPQPLRRLRGGWVPLLAPWALRCSAPLGCPPRLLREIANVPI